MDIDSSMLTTLNWSDTFLEIQNFGLKIGFSARYVKQKITMYLKNYIKFQNQKTKNVIDQSEGKQYQTLAHKIWWLCFEK